MRGSKALSPPGWLIFPLVAVCALSVLGCLLLYQCDNKYTRQGPQAAEGLLVLDEDALREHPVLFLVEGWEYYGGRLLSPADFAEGPPAPDAYIYIGQYGGFDAGDVGASPHGSASYRLRIGLPDERRTYLLELPEIFSAYRLYVNGSLLAAVGDPDPQSYRPETNNSTLSIEAAGEIELLFAVSDFSHLYSGMVYPPAFGEPGPVSALLDRRLVFRSALTVFALAIGLLSVMIGLFSRRSALAILYGLVCLCFVGYTAYPVLLTLGPGTPALYALERVAFCGMLVVVMLLQWVLHGQRERDRWSRYFIGFGALMCAFSALLPLLLPTGSLPVMLVYSLLVTVYEVVAAAFITLTALFALLRRQPYSAVLLGGFLVFDVALLMDRVLPLHEPAVTGWFHELASFVLLLCIAVAVGREMAAKYRESAVLADRQAGMEQFARMQTANYELLMESVEETKMARHDLRHHFAVIGGFLEEGAYDELSGYVREYQLAAGPGEVASYTRNIVADVLLRHYARAAENAGIDFSVRAELGKDAGVSDADLCAVLSNLLENAMEACLRMAPGRRFVSIVLRQQKAALSIQMKNSADRAALASNGSFFSQKASGRTGYGLKSIAAVAARCGGEATFAYDEAAGVFSSTVLLLEHAGPLAR